MRFAKAIVITSKGVFISSGLLMLSHIILARILGPEAIGPVNLARRIVAYIQAIGTAGLYQSLIYYTASTHDEVRLDYVRASIRTCLILASSIVFIFFFWGNSILKQCLKTDFTDFITPLTVLIFIGCLLPIYEAFLSSKKSFEALSNFKIIFSSLMISIGILPVLLYSKTAKIAIWSWTFVNVILVIYIAIRHLKKLKLTLFVSPRRGLYIPLLKYGVPRAFSMFVSRVAMSIDMLIIISMVGQYGFGLYSTAKGVVLALPVLVEPVALASFPYFRAMIAEKNTQWLNATTSKIITLVIVTYLFIAASMIACAPGLIELFLGRTYLGMTHSFQICVLGLLGMSLYSVLRHLINSLSVKPINLYSFSIAAMINIGLTYLLVPMYGIEGAAIASSSSLIMLGLLTVVYIRYRGIQTVTLQSLRFIVIALIFYTGLGFAIYAVPVHVVIKVSCSILFGALGYCFFLRIALPDLWQRIWCWFGSMNKSGESTGE